MRAYLYFTLPLLFLFFARVPFSLPMQEKTALRRLPKVVGIKESNERLFRFKPVPMCGFVWEA